MRILSLVVLAALVSAGCDYERPTVGKTQATAPDESPDLAEEMLESASMTVAGLDLYMHDDADTGKDTAQPTFWVHADDGELTGDESTWTLTGAQAVIYRDGEDNMQLNAATGWFDQTRNMAQLSGGVAIVSGMLRIGTEVVDWNNEQGTVTSASTTELSGGAHTLLSASGFVMNPKTESIILEKPRGTIEFGEM